MATHESFSLRLCQRSCARCIKLEPPQSTMVEATCSCMRLPSLGTARCVRCRHKPLDAKKSRERLHTKCTLSA